MDRHGLPALQLRPWRPEDLDATYEICLKTAASGEDGSERFADHPRAVGDHYAAPYVEFEPELAFVLDDGQGACGYILGASDTAAFEDWLEAVWYPRMRARYAEPAGPEFTPAERLIRRFFAPVRREDAGFSARWPAHLHIDILPGGQGQGGGRRLMERFLEALRFRGVPGVHLGLGITNTRALAFYERMGFTEIERRGDPPDSIFMGLRLD